LKKERGAILLFCPGHHTRQMWASRKYIQGASATPSGIKREWYVCM
jgi:hypothetical protein